jgi:hypothetical protein
MTDQPTNLVLEHLRNFRVDMTGRMDKLTSHVETLTAEVRINNLHVAGLIQSEVLTSQRLAEVETRLDRVERRLNLNDAE